MSKYQVEGIWPSKFDKDGSRWSVKIDGVYYDAYCDFPNGPPSAGLLDLEWKQSKNGKEYIVSIDGKGRRPAGGQQQQRQAAPASRPAADGPREAGEAGPRPYDSTRDQWILISTIVGHYLDRFNGEIGMDGLVALAEGSAKAARAAARIMHSAPGVDAARSAIAAAPEPAPTGRPRPAPVAPDPEAEADQRGATGPDFDDDIPF